MDDLNLAAPCGMYCGSCRQYLALSEGVLQQKGLKHGCQGCRIRDKNCVSIKKDCLALQNKEFDFCFECDKFPCVNLQKLDDLYITRFSTSLISNQKRLKEIGVKKWIQEQKAFFACPECDGPLSIHDDECFTCCYKN